MHFTGTTAQGKYSVNQLNAKSHTHTKVKCTSKQRMNQTLIVHTK